MHRQDNSGTTFSHTGRVFGMGQSSNRILRNGLMASGTQLPSGDLIKPPAGHFQLCRDYFGFKNWAVQYSCCQVFSMPLTWSILSVWSQKRSSGVFWSGHVLHPPPTQHMTQLLCLQQLMVNQRILNFVFLSALTMILS